MGKNATPKIKSNEKIYAVKLKTESNSLGVLKTMIVLFLIFSQAAVLALSYLYFIGVFRWFALISIVLTLVACVHVLSSDYNGQAKATWVMFLLVGFAFGYIFYFASDKRVLFARGRKRYKKIFDKINNLQQPLDVSSEANHSVRTSCQYLFNTGRFEAYKNSKTTYFPSGASLYDSLLEQLEKAEKFIFLEFYIIADGVLLNRVLDILKRKAQEGVDVRIIYDDMGSHGTLKRKTKKQIIQSGIKLHAFNRMVPVFIIALNLRDHRKIAIIDGKVAYTGGANLADEYVNEKRTHGYWKDSGIKIEGPATDNFTIAFLAQWEFLTKKNVDYKSFLAKAEEAQGDGIVVPYVTGPHYDCSIAQNMYANQISDADDRIYIMSPYFVPDETITNLLANKARSGVDVRIVLPQVADKKFVYIVSRNNAEKLMQSGVRLYTMTSSFVHSKVVLTENSAVVGSINMDLRSFNQQFESAVFTSEKSTMQDVKHDFEFTFAHSEEITLKTRKRNRLLFRIMAGIFKLVSPFM